ncbi:MAG: SUMF1/EgtB/PvdO family nonheme iron enzyme [Magnetococcales bacterium]|nr:SUMF1/EgtB/PvdO family nonheme iron enzyme [Magnetococcales bacterium]
MNPEDRYTDWKQIGQGAFGSVCKAYDQLLKRDVAIKLLKVEHGENQSLVEALQREVIISRDLRHNGICPIHDVYHGSKGVGTVMDLIDGIELGKWRDENKGRLLETAELRLELFKELCNVLIFAHTRIVHRDLKPDNVFLRHGDPGRPVIMDFGASMVGKAGKNEVVAGTPKYMSPEQWEAPSLVDERSDLFALGIMVYELFTERLPPTSLRKILKTKSPPKIAQSDISEPSKYCASIPPELDRIILQLMAYKQDDRPQSAQEVLDVLQQVTLKQPKLAGLGATTETLNSKTVPMSGGSFFIGGRGAAVTPEEKPARHVTISPFRISIHQVTVDEYRAFVDSTGYRRPSLLDDPVFGRHNHPIVGVSFDDAQAYAAWAGGALPTEAQWEFAAKGGEAFPLHPWGNDPITAIRANIDNVSEATSPVDSCPGGKTPQGLFDMCGNVWEWCQDVWDPGFYRSITKGDVDPVNAGDSGERVLRGGGFDSFAAQGRCTFRFHAAADLVGRSIGFRLVFPPDHDA